MDTVFRFLAAYEGLIYILLSLGGLFAFRWLWKSWRDWRDSVFSLEREFAVRRMSQAFMVSLLILFLFVGELFLASFVVPALPSSEILATPTLDILDQTQGSFSNNPAIALTVMTPIPNSAPVAATSGCVPEELILTSPEPGQEVSGVVALIGTVNVDNFGFYKYEIASQGTETWQTISAGREPKKNQEIGLWDTSALTPGDYQLRLEVTDNQGNSYPACIISVRVLAP
jgi:hypothetical protein